MTCRRVIVHGHVQGVCFRDSTRQRATELGLVGWVRNCSDGTVEAHLQGPAPAVQGAIDWCRTGPPRAHVTDLDIIDEPPESLTSFAIR